MPLRNAKGRVSLNAGGVSWGLRSVRPWLAVFLPAGRCIELGSAVYLLPCRWPCVLWRAVRLTVPLISGQLVPAYVGCRR